MGREGKRTFIPSGFLAWCNDGSIFEQDIGAAKLPARKPERKPRRHRSRFELPLRKLEPLTRARLARFLAFPHSRIAGEKTFLLQRRPHGRILLQQRPRDGQSNCTGLPRNSPACRLYLNVKRVARFGPL